MLGTKDVAFASKDAADDTMKIYKKSFGREWNRKLKVRRPQFINYALRLIRSRVNTATGLMTRPAVVQSRPETDDILRANVKGDPRRRTKSGKRWFVPSSKLKTRGRRVRRKHTYWADNNLFGYSRKSQSGDNQFLGSLHETISTPDRVNENIPLRIAEKALPRLFSAHLRRKWKRRQGR